MSGKRLKQKTVAKRRPPSNGRPRYYSAMRLSKLKPYKKNPRQNDEAVGAVVKSLEQFGKIAPIIVNEKLQICAGHTRFKAALERNEKTFPTLVVPGLTGERFKAYNIADNQTASIAQWDTPALAEIIKELQDEGFPTETLGFADDSVVHKTLAERFGVPPFSVLDARQGYWQDRKRQWLSLGIESELGRGDGITWGDSDAMRDSQLNHYRKQNRLSPGGSARSACDYSDKQRRDGRGKSLARLKSINTQNWVRDNIASGCARNQSGTSIFDPVLCELMYRWFCPAGGQILDPFAGGSVRGIVASRCGLQYTGIDLSDKQVAANRVQADEICDGIKPNWIAGNSINLTKLIPLEQGHFNFVFSCPPYFDLERYSEDPGDLSNMSWADFLKTYKSIIKAIMTTWLAPNSFACFVVGDIRDKKGLYRNFVSETITAFENAGARLYNEAILVNAIGSLPIRVGKSFTASRKLGKCHQNVLIFYNGNPKQIPEFDYPDNLWAGMVGNSEEAAAWLP